jgi:two-component system sensor histidine kinase/response regulator
MEPTMDADTHILVVDDVPQNLVAISALLMRPGVKVLQATSGSGALEVLLRQDVAVALIDVQMPQMDGFELAELIRGSERTRQTPLIFLTASASDPGRTFRGYEAGAVDFLHKPIDPQVLTSKVDVFVQLHAQKRRLSHQLEQLQQALRMNEVFVAVLGHDLRNPLSAVITGAELVTQLSEDDRVRKVSARIRSSGDRMARMIEQLLDVARIRSGRLEMKPVENNLQHLALSLIDELQAGAGERRIELTVAGETQGRFDADRIAAAVSNLVSNALQHGAPGHPVRVTVDGTRPETLALRVTNSGVVPREVLDTMFEPFHARGDTSRAHGGLGLGLYIVQEFVRAHGGSVRARSDPAEETTEFEIALPRAGAPAVLRRSTSAH